MVFKITNESIMLETMSADPSKTHTNLNTINYASLWFLFKQSYRDQLSVLDHLAETYGDAIRLPGYQTKFLMSHPTWFKQIFVNHSKLFTREGLPFMGMRNILGHSTLTLEGTSWRARRQWLAPLFQGQAIQTHCTTISDTTDRMLVQWEKYAQSQQPFDISHEMLSLVLQITGQCLFKSDLAAISDQTIQYFHTCNQYAGQLGSHYLSWRYIKAMHSKKHLHRLLQPLLKKPHKNSLITHLTAYRDPSTKQHLTEIQLMDELKTLLVTGHETTGSALSWFWHCLQKWPELYPRLQHEADHLTSGSLTHHALNALSYTQQVLEETMRLYPPIWVIVRSLNQDLTCSGHKFKTDDQFLMCTYLLHRHPDFWPQPSHFIPERFSKEQKKVRPSYCYAPFGIGGKSCFASQFALLKMPLIVAKILRKFDVQLLETPQPIAEALVSLRPKHGVWAKIKRRD